MLARLKISSFILHPSLLYPLLLTIGFPACPLEDLDIITKDGSGGIFALDCVCGNAFITLFIIDLES